MSSVVFTDARVRNWARLLSGLVALLPLVLQDPKHHCYTQIANAPEGKSIRAAPHIISHGWQADGRTAWLLNSA